MRIGVSLVHGNGEKGFGNRNRGNEKRKPGDMNTYPTQVAAGALISVPGSHFYASRAADVITDYAAFTTPK